ncbi:hypothetical protein [Hymenobacter chitinivorans]|uniref:Uncharacterized protein n=1 Tax=Hymenobacter chitinivorans DSM 11115 TaxID=1121954 RepID=A0A2M9AQH5_9BACT|nr:hypothetical protein [Hymenobacter chitinivorans]PJJ47957.1 hypothetical protein CLV45_4648 [Hymenobacter chitinivorans DSM 11115]
MKKLSLLLAAVAFGAPAFAQNGTKTETKTTANVATTKKATGHHSGPAKSGVTTTTVKKATPTTKTTTTHTETAKEN